MASDLNLSDLEAEVRSELDGKFAARELALKNSRPIIRNSANAIRALHRGDRDTARALLGEVKVLIAEADASLDGHWDIYHAGFFYDAVKEYAEAELTAALLANEPLPLPSHLGIHAVPYLKGLGEAIGEQRRRLLDQLRHGELEEAERTFTDMETVHDLLTSIDYPDGMTAGLRRTTDVARSLIERSRADLTSTIVQERLRAQLSNGRETQHGD
ncbi:MAG: haloacid dehalogenase [Acidimicrobiia bacterium]|nr:MAG: haloacid dehalogenase [Acidimicrobiia bacterium]